MRTLFLILFSLIYFSSFAGVRNLLPKPQEVNINNETFSMSSVRLSTPVLGGDFSQLIEELGGKVSDKSKQLIEVKIVNQLPHAKLNENEAYILIVRKNKISIEATTSQGVYWAMQTLRQLKVAKGNKTYIEGCEIKDYPAFRIRGFMQDVGRTYIPLDELKREIAKLSQYKINVFHWHLTEDLGWRLESKIFPMLNDSSTFIRMPGQYYTLDEAKELVDFCEKHHVLLIPEVDMPGHSLAFRKAFRHDMQSKEGTAILKLLMDEVCETFDVPYIHIGTDEVQFTNSEFVPEMIKHVRAKGKKVISWNPGWAYKPGEIDMTHLWSYRGQAQEGIPAIDSKFHYINHFDAFADLIALYNSRILNKEYGSDDHAGSIVAVWHDRYVKAEEILIQNNFYPSILALAERSWMGGGSEYFDKNGTVLPVKNDPVFKEFEDFEERLLWHKKTNFQGYPFAYVKQTNVNWRITDAFPNDGDLTISFPPEEELGNSYIYKKNVYKTKKATGAAIYLRHVWGTFVPGFYKEPKPNHTAYAYTYIYSEKKQEVGLWANFQNYGRSEMDLPPPQGKWDYKESRLWINDGEIQPPHWLSSHTTKSNEIPLTNENFEMRDPILVTLNKGWNKVLIKLPVGEFSSPQVRLSKWMFTCVFVTTDGKEAVNGLIYSPDKTLKE